MGATIFIHIQRRSSKKCMGPLRQYRASRQFYVLSIELENNVTYIRAHNPDMKKADARLWKWN